MTDQPRPPRRRRRLFTAVIIVLVLLVVLAVVGYRGYRSVSGSANGNITVAPAKVAAAKPLTRSTETDQYDSYSYGAGLMPSPSQPAVAPVIVNHSYTKRQFGSWQLGVQVSRIPSGSLDDDGSYHYRSVTPSQYTKTQLTINGKSLPVFSDTQGGSFSKVGYLQSGDLVASVSLMGGGATDADAMQTEFSAILSSWHWQ